ncbi:MAG: glycosyltransferase family 4 protein [Candidatus Woesearchaeota archaeon]
MKIVYVLENYLPHIGGVEILFKHICENIAKKHKVVVITHRLPGTKKQEIINNVRIIRVNVPKIGSRYFFTFLAIPTILKEAKNADLIHTTTYNGAPPAYLVSRFLKKPCLINIHEVIGNDWMKLFEKKIISAKLHQILERIIVKLKFTRYVFISKSTANNFKKINKSKNYDIIYCGIDYHFWNKKKYNGNVIRKKIGLENEFIYLFYGRPGPSKGFENLLNAVKYVSKEIPNSKLVAILSKDKAYQKRYKNIIKEIKRQKIEKSVMILEPVKWDNLPNYVVMADCVVVPSLTEGFGFSVAESCALGKKVVASNTTSIPEVISGNYKLVKPGDSKDIAKGIIDMYNGKSKKTKLKKFLWDDCIEDYEKLYNKLIQKK